MRIGDHSILFLVFKLVHSWLNNMSSKDSATNARIKKAFEDSEQIITNNRMNFHADW
jgi:hypothetical protein